MVAVGEAQRARSPLWELDGLYGWCGGGSRSSIVSVGDRRGLWLLWGMLEELNRFCGSLTCWVAVGAAQGPRWFLCGELDRLYGCCEGCSRSSTGSMVAVGESRGARSFLWELDRVFGWCRGGSKSSIVSVGDRRAQWLLWGMLEELDRFCRSSTGSMVAVGKLKELDRFCGSSTGSMVAVGDAQGARSFL